MAVYKNRELAVQSFKFGELIPAEIDTVKNANSFQFQSLSYAQNLKHNLTEESIREERGFESRSDFKISKIIKEHRGLKQQELEDYNKEVREEVERRISEMRTEAYREGFEKGKELGRNQAYEQAMSEFEEKINDFISEIDLVKNDIQNIFGTAKENAYMVVKNLTKWVILKEVDEKYYLSRLLEKLIHEINNKMNLVIHVNQESFGYMPEIIKIVERKVGVLTNLRVEVDHDMDGNGIKLESENTIIDGSLEAQFNSIDKLFKNVIGTE